MVKKGYILYKIICNNPNVSQFYMGTTKNFIRRKQFHKEKTLSHKDNDYLHTFIYNNGGFHNWSMIQLKKLDIYTKREADKELYNIILQERPSLNFNNKEYNNINNENIQLKRENQELKKMIELLTDLII